MRALIALVTIVFVITLILRSHTNDPPSDIVNLVSEEVDNGHSTDCVVENLSELRRSAIVYTWVNGSENCYNKRRQKAGLSPGGSSRDKEMGELKYSIRSLIKFAPWLEGPIYIVTPGQIPDWLDTSNSRIKVIDQDDLLPKDQCKFPNFNTNVIEQYLYKIPGLTDIFIHMNDDYLFIKPVTPNRLFTCEGGIRFLTEINHIRHVKGQKSNAWLASVRNTLELMDSTYGGEHVYNFVKHAPFVYSRLALQQIHEKFGSQLAATLSHQVRHHQDLNVPLLHHVYMNEEGSKALNIPFEFNPISECNDWLLVRVTDDDPKGLQEKFDRALKNQGPEVLFALNDEYSKPETAELVGKFYEKLLPERGFYELPPDVKADPISNYYGAECSYDRDVIPFPATPNSILRQQVIPRRRWKLSPYEVYFTDKKTYNPVVNMLFLVGVLGGFIFAIYVARFVNQDVHRQRTKDY
jgi:hypothetical protein